MLLLQASELVQQALLVLLRERGGGGLVGRRTYSLPVKWKTGAIGHAVRDEVLQNLVASGAYGV